MTVNLLTLNPSKTEFILIGLPQQLSKLSNPSLNFPSFCSSYPPIEQRIQYEVISIAYDVVHNCEPTYHRRLITPLSRGSTRSVDRLFLCFPPLISRLKLSDRSFRNASSHLWNNLHPSLRSPSSLRFYSSSKSSSPTLFPFYTLRSRDFFFFPVSRLMLPMA